MYCHDIFNETASFHKAGNSSPMALDRRTRTVHNQEVPELVRIEQRSASQTSIQEEQDTSFLFCLPLFVSKLIFFLPAI